MEELLLPADNDPVSSPVPGLNWIPLGQLLVDGRILTTEQLQRALELKTSTGQRLGEIVVELGFTTERAIAGALAEQYELEYVDLDVVQLDKHAIALLPEELARRYEALPLRILEDGTPLLAVTDPTNLATADDLRFALGSNFRIAVAERGQIELAIARAYRRSLQLITEEADDAPEEERINDIRNLASSTPTINLVNSLLTTALEEGASDLHFEPRREDMLVRIRVDGVMRELATVPRHMQQAVTSRLKIMGKLDIADRRAPKDGRVTAFFGTGHIDMRIAVLATTHGEQVVLRILGGGDKRPTIADARDGAVRRGRVRDLDRAAVRHRDRLRPDRLRQDDDALRRRRSPEPERPRRDDDRGSGRVPAGRRQPDRGRRQGRPHASRAGSARFSAPTPTYCSSARCATPRPRRSRSRLR